MPDDLLKMKIWEIPRNYSIWSQQQISQNKISLRSFVINVARSFEGHIFTGNTKKCVVSQNFLLSETTKFKCFIFDSKLKSEFSLRGKALKWGDKRVC